jgi:hypothetical protein
MFAGRCTRRHWQQADFRRGIEAQPEQQTQRIQLPAVIQKLLQPTAEEAIHEATPQEQLLEMLVAVATRLGLLPDPENVQQHQKIQNTDNP